MRESSTSNPLDAAPCVVLAAPRGSAPGGVPVDLLRALRARRLDPLLQIDAHEALAELIVRTRDRGSEACSILIVVNPAQQGHAASLLRALDARLPNVKTWQYRTEPRPTLSELTAASLVEPKLRLAHDDPASTHTPENDESPEEDPLGSDPSGFAEELPPLLSEQELGMLLHPAKARYPSSDDPPPGNEARP